MIPLDEVRSGILEVIERLEPVELPSSDALGLVLAADVASTGPDSALRQHGNGRLRGARAEHRRRHDGSAGSPAGGGRAARRARPHDSRGRRRGDPHHDGRAHARRRRRDRHRRAHRTRRRRRGARAAGGARRRSRAAGRWRRRAGRSRVPCRRRARSCAPRRACEHRRPASVQVFRRPRVGVLSTGDELVESGALSPGKIRDSNRPMLLALLEQAGVEAVELGHGARRRSRDDRDARRRARAVATR